jgi:chorismate mutase / prephenate dehydratase
VTAPGARATPTALAAPVDVAYLGPEGTFTEEAARKHFGRAVHLVPLSSIDQVFRAVEGDAARSGVVPVENSTEGQVGRTLDQLVKTGLIIGAEVTLRIHQHLLRCTPSRDGAEVVYSHAQSLAQCCGFLERNLPSVPRVEVVSNAEAARRASGEPRALAIAGAAAAERYGLHLLARGIEDDPHNTTRFLVIGKEPARPTGRDKTSLVMSTKNGPGAMVALLRPLSRNGVSMTKLESRPSREGLWDYVFFADLEGHADDAPVRRALDELGQRASFLKVLGSYPAAAPETNTAAAGALRS